MKTRSLADLKSRLGEAGVRPTVSRLLVLDVLASEAHDVTAQEIHTRLRGRKRRVGLATVYRTLALLADRGVVDELAHRRGEACYRLCSPGHHHHLVCSECHRVEEIADCQVEAWVHDAARTRGFVPISHALEVVGICSACRAA